MMKWIKENDVLLRVVSLLIAVLLWSYVLTEDDPEKEESFTVPIQINGLTELNSRNLVILEGRDTEVTLDVRASMSNLKRLKEEYQLTLIPTISVSHITQPGKYQLAYNIPGKPAEISFSGSNPEVVSLVIDRMITRSIPVELELVGNLASGLVISRQQISPDAVTVTAPASVLDRIACAKVSYNLDSLTDTTQTSVSYTLLDSERKEVTSDYMTVDTASITLDFTLKQSNSVELVVEFLPAPYLTEDMIDYDIDPKALQLQGSLETMQDLGQINLGNIDLRDVVLNDRFTFERVILLPSGVSIKDANQSRFATVTVTLKGCGWREIEFEPELLPGDPLLTYGGQNFKFRVFGSDRVLDALEPEDFILELDYDLDDLVAGENVITVKASLGQDNVHIEGEAAVVATVDEAALNAARNPEPVDPNVPVEPSER